MQKNIIIFAIFLSFALNIKAQNNTGFIRRPRDIQIKKNHLETFGIEIDGDVNAFQVKLTKIFNEQNGTFSKNGTETYYNISLPESETSETLYFNNIYPLYNSNGLMYGITITALKGSWKSQDTFMSLINTYIQKKWEYDLQKYSYIPDELTTIIEYSLKDHSKIIIYTTATDDGYFYIRVTFIDGINATKCGIELQPKKTWFEVNCIFVNGVDKLVYGQNDEEMEFHMTRNNNTYIYFVKGDDKKIFEEIFSSDKISLSAKRTLLTAYNNMVLHDLKQSNSEKNCYYAYYDRFGQIVREIQEEQKRRNESMTPKERTKELMFQYMKNLIFSKKERENLDFLISEDVQKALFSIVGNIALPDSKYQFMGISFSSEEEMRRYKYEQGYDPYY